MLCRIASRVQHADVYCVVLKDCALSERGNKQQPRDKSDMGEPHTKESTAQRRSEAERPHAAHTPHTRRTVATERE